VNRGPYCVVHDTEFMADEDWTGDNVHTNRIVCVIRFFRRLWTKIRLISQGTPAFTSGELLKGYMGDQPPVTRTFVHDAESLLWVLVWVVAHRSQDLDSWKVNADAQELIRDLSQYDMRRLGKFKGNLLEGGLLGRRVEECVNEWSEELALVVGELAEFFRIYFYNRHTKPSFKNLVGRAKERAHEDKNEHESMMNESREATFGRLFSILNTHIARLKDQPINLGLL
jgi:hypothetical protein